MSTTKYISRIVNLEEKDHRIILQNAYLKGFGENGFCASLRSIIREWSLLRQVFDKLQNDHNEFKSLGLDIIFEMVSPEDHLLESGIVEFEYPSESSEPPSPAVSNLPENEYEAALNRVRSWKYQR